MWAKGNFLTWLLNGWQQPLHWRQNDHDGVSNQQPHGCLLNRLFRCRSKKTSTLCVTGLCVWNSPGRWIPRTNGQSRGKCFHLMKSSWVLYNGCPLAASFTEKLFSNTNPWKIKGHLDKSGQDWYECLIATLQFKIVARMSTVVVKLWKRNICVNIFIVLYCSTRVPYSKVIGYGHDWRS